MRRFRAVEIRLRAVDFLPCALHHCFVLMQFVLEFGHLEDGEKLTGPHAIADVHVDGLQVACNLRVHVDFLERPELGSGQSDWVGREGLRVARLVRGRSGARVRESLDRICDLRGRGGDVVHPGPAIHEELSAEGLRAGLASP